MVFYYSLVMSSSKYATLVSQVQMKYIRIQRTFADEMNLHIDIRHMNYGCIISTNVNSLENRICMNISFFFFSRKTISQLLNSRFKDNYEIEKKIILNVHFI